MTLTTNKQPLPQQPQKPPPTHPPIGPFLGKVPKHPFEHLPLAHYCPLQDTNLVDQHIPTGDIDIIICF